MAGRAGLSIGREATPGDTRRRSLGEVTGVTGAEFATSRPPIDPIAPRFRRKWPGSARVERTPAARAIDAVGRAVVEHLSEDQISNSIEERDP